jgi:predicted permease
METLVADVRYGLRTLFRTPGWTSMAVLTLALGVGATTAVFSFVDALLFRQASGVGAGATLVSVYTSDFSSGPYGDSSYPDFVSMGSDTTAFVALAAEDGSSVAPLRVGNEMERVRTSRVSGTYFDVIGGAPALGRWILEEDTSAARPPVAVISHTLWQRAFGSDSGVIGTTVMLNGTLAEIIGVASPRFRGLDLGHPIDVWIPLTPASAAPAERGNRWLAVTGRLRPSVSLSEAQAQLATLAARLAREYPTTNLGTLERPHDPRPMFVLAATRIPPSFRGEVVMLSAVLMGGVALVLLLACANVASLFLARATTRGRELAMRRALGATAGRLIRQLLTETAILAAAAAGLGLLFAAWTADVLPSFFPPEQAIALDAAPGPHVFAFSIAVAVVAAIIVGLLPATRAVRPALAPTLRGSAGDIIDPGASRSRNVLVSIQVAIACVLLVSAALLTQSVARSLKADLGFSTRDALLTSVDLPSTWTEEQGNVFYEQAQTRVQTLPGVESAAWARSLPLGGTSRRGFRPEGYVPRSGEDLELNVNIVSAGYFETLGIPVLNGRAFDRTDTTSSRPVVVINDTLASRFFKGSPVGRHLTDSRKTVVEIIGVVRSGAHLTVGGPPVPLVYYPLPQSYSPRLSLIVRAGATPKRLAEDIKRQIRSLNADVPVFRTVTLRSHLEEALAAERLTASLVACCGLFSLTLAVLGLYGALSYLVSRRTKEIGVRIALGAEPRHVLFLVVGHGIWIAVAGITVGIAGAIAAGRAVSSFLYGISALDPQTYIVVTLTLLGVAALSAYVPARRAVRIDPARALIHE